MRGGGFDASITAVAESLLGSASGGNELTTAVLLMEAPFTTGHLTCATKVTIAVAVPAIDAKVTVRLLSLPPQIPPSVDEHDTKETVEGRLLLSVTWGAAADRKFVTVIVYVTLEPVNTVFGLALWLTARSGATIFWYVG